MFDKGDATIAANEANMNLTSLTNTGGTIEGSDTLSITSQSDITNTSGMIKGGDVSLTSTDGSIVNQTLVSTTGREGNMTTDFGKSARSEEHTSELQSLMRISYAVFCLKKKTKTIRPQLSRTYQKEIKGRS